MSFAFTTTPFANTRQFYYALERGLVSADGLDVAVEHNHSPEKDQLLVCGGVDAATMSMGKYVTAKLVSHTDAVPTDPLAVAAGLTYREGNGLFVPADSPVEAPGDLAGRRVGIHDTTLAMTYHKAILEERFDLPPDRIEWVVDTHQGLADRLAAGELDAVERINDWYWELRAGEEYRLLYDMGEQWRRLHGYDPLVHLVAVDRARYEERPDDVRAFLRALRRSREYREDNYEEVLDALSGEGEWTGGSEETFRRLLSGVRCPLELGAPQRENVTDWMRYADRYGVFASAPVADERLFPDREL